MFSGVKKGCFGDKWVNYQVLSLINLKRLPVKKAAFVQSKPGKNHMNPSTAVLKWDIF